MYCPNCGQQQISDEMRFCSRCGLALTGLAEWLAGGPLAVTRANEAQLDSLSPRRKAMRRAGKLMFASGVLLPVFFAISLFIDEAGPMILPLVLFFISLVMMLYARLFSDTAAVSNIATLPGQPAQPSLPTISVARPQVRTNELTQPRSVTENTTRLLDNE